MSGTLKPYKNKPKGDSQMFVTAEKTHCINYCDQSGLNCFQRCPAKYFFERVIGLRDPSRRKITLDYGTIMHNCFPLAYKDIDGAIELFKQQWEKYGYGEDDKARNTDRAELALRDFHRVNNSQFGPYEPLDPPTTNLEVSDAYSDKEVPFLLDIGAEFPLAGRIDRIVRWKPTNEIYPLDYKTSSEISARLFSNFENCLQVVLYTLACSQILDYRAAGIILEFSRVSPKNTETVAHPNLVSDRWMEVTVEWVRHKTTAIKEMNESKKWVMNPCACAPYSMFGSPGFSCDYKMLCGMPDWRHGAKFYNIDLWHPINLKGESDA